MSWELFAAIGVGVTISIAAVVFMLVFRREISALLQGTTIDRGGVRVDPAQRTGSTEHDPRAEAETLMRELDSTLVREAETHIQTEFQKRNLAGDEALRVAVRYLAAVTLAFEFERIYGAIWGTQLSLLTHLNTQASGQPADALRSFYTLGSTLYPDAYKQYAFEQWLTFLKDNVLIREDAATLHITVRGREFLTYLTRMGYTHNKVG